MRKCAVSEPRFRKPWAVPGGTRSVRPARAAADAVRAEGERARDALEPLGLLRWTCAGTKSRRPDEELGGDPLARPLDEDDALAGHRILDRVGVHLDRPI